jgi:hypothetical protein
VQYFDPGIVLCAIENVRVLLGQLERDRLQVGIENDKVRMPQVTLVAQLISGHFPSRLPRVDVDLAYASLRRQRVHYLERSCSNE